MKDYIIVEDKFDLEFLSIILPSELLNNTKLISAGGYSSSLSLAKTIVENNVNYEKFIFLIINADTTDEIKIRENENFIKNYIGFSENLKIFLLVPELEAFLFESKELIERISKKSVSSYELKLGKLNPREALKLLNVNDKLEALLEISESDIKLILKNSQVNAIVQSLEVCKKAHNSM